MYINNSLKEDKKKSKNGHNHPAPLKTGNVHGYKSVSTVMHKNRQEKHFRLWRFHFISASIAQQTVHE